MSKPGSQTPKIDLQNRSRRGKRIDGRKSPADRTIVNRVIEYVDEHFAASITLRDVARSLGYSPTHLTSVFSRYTGTPVTAWIIRRRIRAAEALLREGDVPVAAVCEAVGFNDVCYFTRQFVRNVGTTPGRYRRTHADRSQPSIAIRTAEPAFESAKHVVTGIG